MMLDDCLDCKAKKCEFSATFSNMMFCYSEEFNEYGASMLNDRDYDFHFILTPFELQLLKLNVPLCSFDPFKRVNTSFFHEIIVDSTKLAEYVHSIFKSIKYDPEIFPIATKNRTIKIIDVDSYLERRRLMMRSIDPIKAAAYENHGIDIVGFYSYV